MSRSKARELLMSLFFEMEARGEFSPEIRDRVFKEGMEDKSQKEYLETMYSFAEVNLSAADELIERYSANWKIDRMCKVDLAVMRIAVLEIMYMDDIPDAVSINEAVDIAKKYGTEESGRFVNGILGKVVKMKNAG